MSRRLDRLCGPIVQRTITDEVHPGGCPSIRVRHWPVASFTTVTEYDATTPAVLTREDFDTNHRRLPARAVGIHRQCSTG